MDLLARVKRLAFPHRGDLLRVRFREAGRPVEAFVPDDEIFGLAREIVLQCVYDPIPAGTVIDAGAHVGLFTLAAAQHASKVVSLEPDPVNFRVLEANIELNGLENVVALNRAVWSEPGDISFHSSWHTTGGRVGAGGDITVRTATLDELVEAHGPVDLLKLDIEGAEDVAIPSATRLDGIARIAAELHLSRPGQEQPLLAALRRAGFHVELVPAPELYRARWARTVRRNWSVLEGRWRVKAAVLAYMLAPVSKPRMPPGARRMPLLFATRG